MDEKSKEAEYWRLTAKGVYDEYLEEMHELQGQLKDREATLKQEESFVRQLDADNEELRALKKLETQEASSSKDGHRERAVVKRAEGGPQANYIEPSYIEPSHIEPSYTEPRLGRAQSFGVSSYVN